MGGRPISALSIVAYPAKGDFDDLQQILKGGAEKMHEVNCSILGGHSVDDAEIKFGYSVTGLVHPDRVKTNAGARPGDVVMFSKAIGTGVIGTALKRGIARQEHVEAAIASMLTLNREACEEMLRFDVHGCTDITGFGLIGHAREMAIASGVTLEIEVDNVRLLPGVLDYARAGALPGGLHNNREFASCAVEVARDLPRELEDLLYDPQTSGGLFYTLPERDAAKITKAWRVGRVAERGDHAIRLL